MAGKYLKNITKSIGLASFDALKDLNPTLTSGIESNKEFIADNYKAVKEYVKSDVGLRNSEYYKSSKSLIKQALHEIKTGELYSSKTKNAINESVAEQFGIDMKDFDMDFSDIEDMDDGEVKSSSKTKESSKTEEDTNETTTDNNVDITNNNTRNYNRSITNNVIMSQNGNKATNKILSSSSKAMLESNRVATTALLQSINVISTFQNETTVQFYNDVSNKLAEIGNALTSVKEMFAQPESSMDNSEIYGSELEDFLMNSMNLDFYKRKAQRGGGGAFDFLKEELLPMIKTVGSNPLGFALVHGIKSLMPKSFKNAMGDFNSMLESLPISLQFMLGKWKNSNSPIKKFFGNTFGINLNEKPKLQFGKYEKGRIPFDGVTKRAITNTIPSLLAKILASVSDNPYYKQELVYDYEKGRFTTKELVKKHIQNEINDKSINVNLDEFKKKALSEIGTKNINKNTLKDMDDALRKLVNNAAIPDMSVNLEQLSSNPLVASAIRNTYLSSSGKDKAKFKKNMLEALQGRNSVYSDLNRNFSYHNAFDLDLDMIKDSKEEEKKLTKEEQLKRLGLSEDNPIYKFLNNDGFETGFSKSKKNPFNLATKGINKATNFIESLLYHEEISKDYKTELKNLDDDIFSNDFKSGKKKSKSKARATNSLREINSERVDINANIVNVYGGTINNFNSNGKKKKKKKYKKTTKNIDEILEEEMRNNESSSEATSNNNNNNNKNDDDTIEMNGFGPASITFAGSKLVNKIKDKIFNPIVNFTKNKILNPIKNAFNKAKDYIRDVIFNPLKEAFMPLMDRGKDWLRNKKDKAKSWFRNTFMGGKTLKELWSSADTKIRNGVGSMTASINSGFNLGKDNKDNSIKDDISETFEKAKDFASEATSKARKKFENGKMSMKKFKNLYKKKMEEFLDKTFKGNGKNKAKKNLNMNDSSYAEGDNSERLQPSQELANIDKNVEHMKITLDDFYNAFLASQGVPEGDMPETRGKISGRFGRIKNWFKVKFNKLGSFIKNPFEGMGAKIKEKLESFKKIKNILEPFKKILQAPKKIKELFDGMFGGVKKFGKEIIKLSTKVLPRIGEGIKKAGQKIFDGAKKVTETAIAGTKKVVQEAVGLSKAVYGDLKDAVKEVWGTAKSAVSAVWGRFSGKKDSSGKEKAMRVILDGGYLDEIKKPIQISKNKISSYDQQKQKYIDEQAEDSALHDSTTKAGMLSDYVNEKRSSAFRERVAGLFGSVKDGIINWVKDSRLGRWVAEKKYNLGNKLANNTKKGVLGSIGRAVGKFISNPDDITAQGMTPVYIMGSNIPMGSDSSGGISDLVSNGEGIFSRMFGKFSNSKLGKKFAGTKMGGRVMKTAGKFLGTGAEAGEVAGKVAGVASGASKLGKLGKVAGFAGKVAGKFAVPLAIASSAIDGISGWGHAGEIFNTKDATLGQKISSSLGNIASGLTFGLLGEGTATKAIHKTGTFLTNLIPGVALYRHFKDKKEKSKKNLSNTLDKASEHWSKRDKAKEALNSLPGLTNTTDSQANIFLKGQQDDKKGQEDGKEGEKIGFGRRLLSISGKALTMASPTLSIMGLIKNKLFSSPNDLANPESAIDSIKSKAENFKVNQTGIENLSANAHLGASVIPFVSPTLLQGRNLITAYRFNKKREDEAEKKLLQQMSPKEREAYLASKTNSSILQQVKAFNPLLAMLSTIFGGKGQTPDSMKRSAKKKEGFLKRFTKKITGLLGLNTLAGVQQASKGGGFFSKLWGGIKKFFGFGDDEEGTGVDGSSSSGSADGSVLGIKSRKDIWKLSAKYETSFNGTHGRGKGSGTISRNNGDYGGPSYGIPQFSLTTGSLKGFVNSLKETAPDMYAKLSRYPLASKEFDEAWYQIAESDGERFADLQGEYSGKNYYEPLKKNLKNKYGLDLDKRGLAINALTYSTAIQYGPNGLAMSHYKNAMDKYGGPDKITDEQLIIGVQDSKLANVDSNFSKSSASIRQSVRDRIPREKEDALAILRSETGMSGGGGSNSTGDAVVRAARTQLGVPYLWGGTSPGKGLDCSGLTQYAYRQAGVNISRTTYTQVKEGHEVSQSEAQPGDLIFSHWSNSSTPEHVSIYAGNNRRIHAPRTGDVVKEDKMPSGRLMFRRLYGSGRSRAMGGGFAAVPPGSQADGFGDVNKLEGNFLGNLRGSLDRGGKSIASKAKAKPSGGTIVPHSEFLKTIDQSVRRMKTRDITDRPTGFTSNTLGSSVSSTYQFNNDAERMERYSKMVTLLNEIAENTGNIVETNKLLSKMLEVLKKDKKDRNEDKPVFTNNLPFINGIDNDIDLIAGGI